MKNLCALLLVLIPSFALSQPSTAEQATQDLVALFQTYVFRPPPLEVVRELVAKGANVNHQVLPSQESPLHSAVLRPWTKHVRALLMAPDLNIDQPGAHKKTALHHAVSSGFSIISQILLEAGASAHAPLKISVSKHNWPAICEPLGYRDSRKVVVTPLLCAAFNNPLLIRVLGPYVHVDLLNLHPDAGWITELEWVILSSNANVRPSISRLLAEGACVDRLSEESRLKMNNLLESGTFRWPASRSAITIAASMRRYATLNDIEKLTQFLSELPADLPSEAQEELMHAFLNAVRSELLDAAHLLWEAGASRKLAVEWLLRHQTCLTKVQQQLLTELSPSRFLAALRQDRSSLVSVLPLDIVRLISPLVDDERTPAPLPMPPAAAAAMTL